MADAMDALLITGAGGYLGGHLAAERARAEPSRRIVLVDFEAIDEWLPVVQTLRSKSNVHIIRADIRDGQLISEILKDYRVSQVIHAATSAQAGEDPSELMDATVAATLILLEACRVAWLQSDMVLRHKFHFVSSADILQANASGAVFDAAPIAPESLSAASLAAAEAFVIGYSHRHRLNVTISYPTSIYGPGQEDHCLIPGFVKSLLDGRRIPLYGDAGASLDLLHVRDAVRAISAIADRGTTGNRYGIHGTTANMAEILATLSRSIDELASNAHDFTLRFPRSPLALGKHSSSLITRIQDRRTIIRPRTYMFNALATVLPNPERTSVVEGLQEVIADLLQLAEKSSGFSSDAVRQVA
jgi:dTDP-glucose 4,6-dehydratase